MRHILTAAAAIAVCGILSSVSAQAMDFIPGGPKQVGNMCRVSTYSNDSDYFGYWAPCPEQTVAQAGTNKRKSR